MVKLNDVSAVLVVLLIVACSSIIFYDKMSGEQPVSVQLKAAVAATKKSEERASSPLPSPAGLQPPKGEDWAVIAEREVSQEEEPAAGAALPESGGGDDGPAEEPAGEPASEEPASEEPASGSDGDGGDKEEEKKQRRANRRASRRGRRRGGRRGGRGDNDGEGAGAGAGDEPTPEEPVPEVPEAEEATPEEDPAPSVEKAEEAAEEAVEAEDNAKRAASEAKEAEALADREAKQAGAPQEEAAAAAARAASEREARVAVEAARAAEDAALKAAAEARQAKQRAAEQAREAREAADREAEAARAALAVPAGAGDADPSPGAEEEDEDEEKAPVPAPVKNAGKSYKSPGLHKGACLGKTEPWYPFPGHREGTVGKPAAADRRLLAVIEALMGNGTGEGGDGDGGGWAGGEEGGGGAARRRLLSSRRGSSSSTRPLEPKCRSEKTRRNLAKGEDGLIACIKGDKKKCISQNPKEVVGLAENLLSMRRLSSANVKCFMVHNKGSCRTVNGNPETKPYSGGAQRPPTQGNDIPKSYQTCALVGNGPGVLGKGLSPVIDQHDAVFRFNSISRSADQGTKSTFRIFNKKRAELIGKRKIGALYPGEKFLFWNYMTFPYMAKIKANNKETYAFAPDLLKYMISSYFAVRKDLHRLGYHDFGCPRNINSGLHGLFLALKICKEVNIYGFSYMMSQITSRGDAISPRMSIYHDWKFDTVLLRMLALSGKINLCT